MTELQGADRHIMRQVQQLVQQRMEQLGTAVTGIVSSQGQQYSAMVEDLEAFKVQKEQDIAQLKDQVNTPDSCLDDLLWPLQML